MKALNLLRVVAHAKWGSDEATLLHLYRSLIRSKLDYGAIVYGSARKSAGSDPKSGTPPRLGCISNIASHKLPPDSTQHWVDTNGFKFSETKTVCMHFNA